MTERSKGMNDALALVAALVAVLLGAGILILARSVLDIENEATVLTLLLLPAVVYGVFSGRLHEFKGPGGIALKFAKVAEETVKFEKVPVGQFLEQMPTVRKGTMDALDRELEELDPDKPAALTVGIGQGHLSQAALRTYARELSRYPDPDLVLFLRDDRSLLSYMDRTRFLAELESDDRGRRFVNALNEGDERVIKTLPGMMTERIDRGASNAEALKRLTELDRSSIVVVNDDDTFAGLIRREALVGRMLVAATG